MSSNLLPPLDSRSERFAEEVYAERIRTLFEASPWIIATNPLNAAVVAAVLWPSANKTWLLVWVLLTAGATVIRAVLRTRYLRRAPSKNETSLWALRYTVGTTAVGLLWGAAGAVFYEPTFPTQLLIIFVIGGMVAGASGTLALHMPAFVGFSASAVLPTATRLWWEGDWGHIAMGCIAIFFAGAMTLVAANSHRAVGEAFRLRFENQDLLANLSAMQNSLEEANRTLEQRVAERSTALERQTEALRDAQRMESVGLLAGGIAHDFNNLLTIVLGNAEMVAERLGPASPDRASLEHISSAAKRGAMLVRQLLTFSRRQVTAPKVLDLNVVVLDVQPFLSRLIGEHIELRMTLHPAPLPVKADPTQLHQVILNLATNARDAMPSGGRLSIRTELQDEPQPSDNIPQGSYVVLSVQDTGVGMDVETKRMAFHPFFTTKEVGRGTGLGLATVYGIVEGSAGHLAVESEVGRGSSFRVFLPYVADAINDAVIAAPYFSVAKRSANILVVEDEPAVRELTIRTLAIAGFSVIGAENGEHALEVARSFEGHLDLVVTDVVMPKLGGFQLAEKLGRERPGVPILFVSGYIGSESVTIEGLAGPAGFLHKPFTRSELIEKVVELLGDSATSASPAKIQTSNHRNASA